MTDQMHIRRTYTPEQRALVEQYESCCRLYLEMNGQDPERRVEMNHPTIIGAKVFCQAWEMLVPDFYDEELRFISMMQTRGERSDMMAKAHAAEAEPELKLVKG